MRLEEKIAMLKEPEHLWICLEDLQICHVNRF